MPDINKSKNLQTAVDAIKIGAKIALSYYDRKIEVRLKDDKTIVTKADIEVEEAIKKHILSVFPNSKFVGEETGGNIDEKKFWIIDPIDGTRSFVRGIPTWCVMVAYCVNKEIKLAACYFPAFDSIVWCEKGKGAYCDNKKVTVSHNNKLNESWLSPSHLNAFVDKAKIIELISKSANVRMMGNYSLYLVAIGKMDAFVDPYLKVWDLAPWKIIIEEAGGRVTRMNGDAWDLEGQGGIISNGLIHDEILQIINE